MNNDEVIFNTEDVIKINEDLITVLKNKAECNESKKVRLCLHKSLEDNLHEMIIVHSKGQYVRPHKHPVKTESFHMIEGGLWVIIFDDLGNIKEKFKLESREVRNYFAFRIEKNVWHTVVPITDKVVFHEITNGPFSGNGDSEFSEWSPNKDDEVGIIKYQNFLNKVINIEG